MESRGVRSPLFVELPGIPRLLAPHEAKVVQSARSLREQLGREPSQSEIARHSRVPYSTVQNALGRFRRDGIAEFIKDDRDVPPTPEEIAERAAVVKAERFAKMQQECRDEVRAHREWIKRRAIVTWQAYLRSRGFQPTCSL